MEWRVSLSFLNQKPYHRPLSAHVIYAHEACNMRLFITLAKGLEHKDPSIAHLCKKHPVTDYVLFHCKLKSGNKENDELSSGEREQRDVRTLAPNTQNPTFIFRHNNRRN